MDILDWMLAIVVGIMLAILAGLLFFGLGSPGDRPCADFANRPINDVPARCFSEYKP